MSMCQKLVSFKPVTQEHKANKLTTICPRPGEVKNKRKRILRSDATGTKCQDDNWDDSGSFNWFRLDFSLNVGIFLLGNALVKRY